MSPRQTIALNDSWHFQADPAGSGLQERWFEIGLPQARVIRIPHTWNVEEGLEEYRGIGWYEYELPIESSWQEKSIRLQFNAVYRDAVIWVNGQQVGTHMHSGYTAFIIDITDFVKLGMNNRLVVSVNNENSEQALPMRNSFDWADDGGIIREVSLLVTGKAAIDYSKITAFPIFTESGICAGGVIKGELSLWPRNNSSWGSLMVAVSIWLKDTLLAKEQYDVNSQNGKVKLRSIGLPIVELWHFDHPHLYSVDIELIEDGVAMDRISTSVGFREIVTQGNRLLLNREPVRLMGVEWMPGSHPDKGMAESEADLIKVLEQMKHANCVITRFHWQQDSRLLDWCDRNGMLVQEEIPHWQQPSEPDERLLPVAKQHADEMINRHYNHPSIYAWGMGNEVNGQDERTIAYMQQLKQYMQTLDEHRLINYVSNSVHFEPKSDATGTGDLLMWNDYIGTWHGDLDVKEVIGSIDQAYPDKPLVVAEYGLCEPAYTGGDPRRIQILQEKTEEYRKHEGIAALIFFSLNDYRTQMGEEGTGKHRQRVHGTTDIYGQPKPSYQALREIGSPLVMKVVAAEEEGLLSISLAVRNDIPSHSINGYQFIVETTDGHRSVELIPKLAPGEAYTFTLTTEQFCPDMYYSIIRPTGSSVADGRLITNRLI